MARNLEALGIFRKKFAFPVRVRRILFSGFFRPAITDIDTEPVMIHAGRKYSYNIPGNHVARAGHRETTNNTSNWIATNGTTPR